MAEQYPNYKRHDENDGDEPKQKYGKRDGNEQEAAIPTNACTQPKSLTNINYDCLERILEFLDLKNLLNLAQTCKRLQIAAAAQFGDDHGERCVWLNPLNYDGVPEFGKRGNELWVRNFQIHLPFLRCFGAKISNLVVDCDGSTASQDAHIDRYINEYCADTLKIIKFWYKVEISGKHIPKPFKNIEKVDISCSSLTNNLSSFVHLFPNLRELKLCSVDIDETAIAVCFPHLVHLELNVDTTDNKTRFNNENVVHLLHANPQLKYLTMASWIEMSSDKLLDLIIGNPSISKWTVRGSYFSAVNAAEVIRLASEHPNIEELIFANHEFTADVAMTFISQSDSLKHFEFQVEDQSECDRLLNQLNQNWQHQITDNGLKILKLN